MIVAWKKYCIVRRCGERIGNSTPMAVNDTTPPWPSWTKFSTKAFAGGTSWRGLCGRTDVRFVRSPVLGRVSDGGGTDLSVRHVLGMFPFFHSPNNFQFSSFFH